MMLKRFSAFAGAASLGVVTTSCVTTSGPLTVEQKIGSCVDMIGAGAALGGSLGNNAPYRGTSMYDGGAVLGGNLGNDTGSGGAGDSLLAGEVAGGGCAVWLAFQNAADRERMLAAQRSAVATGMPQRESWVGTDGRDRMVTIAAMEPQTVNYDAADDQEVTRTCRWVNTTASVAGTDDTLSEVWCRGENNEWAPSEDQTILS